MPAVHNLIVCDVCGSTVRVMDFSAHTNAHLLCSHGIPIDRVCGCCKPIPPNHVPYVAHLRRIGRRLEELLWNVR